MDEQNPNARSRRMRVLRAADVIPPFDKNTELTDADPASADCGLAIADSPRKGDSQHEAPPRAESAIRNPQSAIPGSSAEAVEIPSYDLAANILADQRRVASRRRRAPGQTDDKPTDSRRASGVRTSTDEPRPSDLPELQRIVAEIVARDIERLCRRPNRPPMAHV